MQFPCTLVITCMVALRGPLSSTWIPPTKVVTGFLQERHTTYAWVGSVTSFTLSVGRVWYWWCGTLFPGGTPWHPRHPRIEGCHQTRQTGCQPSPVQLFLCMCVCVHMYKCEFVHEIVDYHNMLCIHAYCVCAYVYEGRTIDDQVSHQQKYTYISCIQIWSRSPSYKITC